MAKSAKKRVVNSNGVKRVSKDRIAVGVRNLDIVNRLSK
jgi:hypothetical protein